MDRKTLSCLLFAIGEKPETGHGLSPRGQQRAEALQGLLHKLHGGFRLEPQAVFAAKDSRQSHRPHLTRIRLGETIPATFAIASADKAMGPEVA